MKYFLWKSNFPHQCFFANGFKTAVYARCNTFFIDWEKNLSIVYCSERDCEPLIRSRSTSTSKFIHRERGSFDEAYLVWYFWACNKASVINQLRELTSPEINGNLKDYVGFHFFFFPRHSTRDRKFVYIKSYWLTPQIPMRSIYIYIFNFWDSAHSHRSISVFRLKWYNLDCDVSLSVLSEKYL